MHGFDNRNAAWPAPALALLLVAALAAAGCHNSRSRAASSAARAEAEAGEAAAAAERRTVTGVLTRVAAIGGETTGWALRLDEPAECGEKVTKLLEVAAAEETLAPLEEQHVEAAGRIVWRTGVERGRWPVLQIESLRAAPR